MSQFVKKAVGKIEKLSDEEILRIIETQNNDLKIRNLILDSSFEGALMVSENGNIVYLNNTFTSLIPVATRRKYSDVNVGKVILNNEILTFVKSFIASAEDQKGEFFEVDDPAVGTRALDCSARRISDYKACLFGRFLICDDLLFGIAALNGKYHRSAAESHLCFGPLLR